MKDRNSNLGQKLNLKAGEWVEIRSREEVLATLDERGCLENVPFMPEMLECCGKRVRVSNRADKTCDPGAAPPWTIRRLKDSVHLEGMRCDGSMHGGCEAGCLVFWKEAWLRRAESNNLIPSGVLTGPTPSTEAHGLLTVESLLAASRKRGSAGETIYFCQATEVRNFTSFMRWWDPWQYVRDIRSGNLSTVPAEASRLEKLLDLVVIILRIVQAVCINAVWERRGILYPTVKGQLGKTPLESLDLQPGELVQVRSKEEIVGTLNKQNRNHGLLFDTEMVPYCGGIYRVLRRVHHIVDEKTGVMVDMKYPCIVLEGVVCKSDFHRLCPRAIYSYWRENWLTRAVPSMPSTAETGSGRHTAAAIPSNGTIGATCRFPT